jgi:hypothetical protein
VGQNSKSSVNRLYWPRIVALGSVCLFNLSLSYICFFSFPSGKMEEAAQGANDPSKVFFTGYHTCIDVHVYAVL